MVGESSVQGIPAGHLKVGEWLVDPQLDELSRGGEVHKLEPRMVRLLVKLAESRGQVVSTQQLLDSVWSGVIVGPASVYQAVSTLRKLLGDTDPTPTYIATVPRKGYRLVAPVEFPGATPDATPAAEAAPVTSKRRTWAWALGAAGLAVMVIAGLLLAFPRHEEESPRQSATTPVSADKRPSLAIARFAAGGTDDDSRLLALAVRELIHTRLITQDDLILLSTSSTALLEKPNADVVELCRKMNTRFLLRGRTARAGNQVRVELTLLEPGAGRTVWTSTWERDPAQITALREEIVAQIAKSLQVKIGPKGNVPIDLDAYQLLMRGIEQMLPLTEDAYRTAHDLYFRNTILHPDFARAYLFVGHALALQSLPEGEAATRRHESAMKAYERATELDPALGEAWIGRADLTADRVEAEKLFLKGLALSPNYDLGYFKYSLFLFSSGRLGEAISQTEKARRLDPMSIMPTMNYALFMGHARGNVTEHDRLLHELLEWYPNFPLAYQNLARSRYVWGGAPAEAAQLIEKLAALDPSTPMTAVGTAIYLDLGDVAAATSYAAGEKYALVQLAQYQHRPLPPLQLTRNEMATLGFLPLGHSMAEALRDQAIATGNFASALDLLEASHPPGLNPPSAPRKLLLVHAHTLVLSGAPDRGRALATATLKMLESEGVGRPPYWYARERASAYMILGDYDRALAELADSQKNNDFTRWWYTAEVDPLFAPLRKDPRFQELVEAARRHNAQQRVLLDEMRRKGEIRRRPS